ncbi:MAG: hypothetical protein ACU836_11070 [Gammaproteobacteria bacterium]
MMLKKWVYGLPLFLIAACSETPDRYEDARKLELPPELSLEHARSQPAIEAEDRVHSSSSPLAGLMAFEDDGKKPVLTLKTRPERAWDMVVVALKISNIEIVDKNREERRLRVRFDPDTAGKEESWLDIFSSDSYPEAEYNIALKEEIPGVIVNVALSEPDRVEPGTDSSAELLRFLHKVIDEKIINRPRYETPQTNTEE